jgi:hypothetical protein
MDNQNESYQVLVAEYWRYTDAARSQSRQWQSIGEFIEQFNSDHEHLGNSIKLNLDEQGELCVSSKHTPDTRFTEILNKIGSPAENGWVTLRTGRANSKNTQQTRDIPTNIFTRHGLSDFLEITESTQRQPDLNIETSLGDRKDARNQQLGDYLINSLTQVNEQLVRGVTGTETDGLVLAGAATQMATIAAQTANILSKKSRSNDATELQELAEAFQQRLQKVKDLQQREENLRKQLKERRDKHQREIKPDILQPDSLPAFQEIPRSQSKVVAPAIRQPVKLPVPPSTMAPHAAVTQQPVPVSASLKALNQPLPGKDLRVESSVTPQQSLAKISTVPQLVLHLKEQLAAIDLQIERLETRVKALEHQLNQLKNEVVTNKEDNPATVRDDNKNPILVNQLEDHRGRPYHEIRLNENPAVPWEKVSRFQSPMAEVVYILNNLPEGSEVRLIADHIQSKSGSTDLGDFQRALYRHNLVRLSPSEVPLTAIDRSKTDNQILEKQIAEYLNKNQRWLMEKFEQIPPNQQRSYQLDNHQNLTLRLNHLGKGGYLGEIYKDPGYGEPYPTQILTFRQKIPGNVQVSEEVIVNSKHVSEVKALTERSIYAQSTQPKASRKKLGR